jgi:hypothetical protein
MGALPTTVDCFVHVISFLEPKETMHLLCNREALSFLRSAHVTTMLGYTEIFDILPQHLSINRIIYIRQLIWEHGNLAISYLMDTDVDICHLFKIIDENQDQLLVEYMRKKQLSILGLVIPRLKSDRGVETTKEINTMDDYIKGTCGLADMFSCFDEDGGVTHLRSSGGTFSLATKVPLHFIQKESHFQTSVYASIISDDSTRLIQVLGLPIGNKISSVCIYTCISLHMTKCFDILVQDRRFDMSLCEDDIMSVIMSYCTSETYVYFLKKLVLNHNFNPMVSNGKYIENMLNPLPMLRMSLKTLSVMLDSPRIDLQFCLEKARLAGNRAAIAMINKRILLSK